jgi:uncharacterized membrane protein YeaQ/YmgE (transglycosylase-associated protein family)
MSIFIWIVIGLLAGWLANAILGNSGGGLLYKLAVGLVGAIVGGLIFNNVGLAVKPTFLGELISATVGAVVFLLIWRGIRRA